MLALGSHLLSAPLLATDIEVGVHPQVKLAGLTVDIDTVWATVAAALVVMLLGLILRAKVTSGVPGKFQVCWEALVGAVQGQVNESIGPRGAKVVPLAVTIFIFIFVCNMFGSLGLGSRYEFLPAPTSDINLPLAMSIFVIVLVHLTSIRNRGVVGYVKHYLIGPFPLFLFPVNLFMNVVDEIAKPLTLALRLFGNLLAGGLMLSLLAALTVWKIGPLPLGPIFVVPLNLVWKLFDLGIGAIQAFIFALLTIVYFDTAMAQPDLDH